MSVTETRALFTGSIPHMVGNLQTNISFCGKTLSVSNTVNNPKPETPNTDTFETCVKVDNSETYTDSIERNLIYDQSTRSYKIRFINTCGTAYDIPNLPISINTDSGTLVGMVIGGHIGANSTVELPVVFNGSYSGSMDTLTGTVTLNGTSTTISIFVTDVPKPQDTPPIANDVEINLENRQNLDNVQSHLKYSDAENHQITHMKFEGDVSRLTANGTPVVVGQEYDINTNIKYTAPDQDSSYEFTTTYNVKANGLWSN